MLKIFATLGLAASLAGCAMSLDGLAKAKVEDEYTSTKAPREIALCMKSSLHGSVDMTELSGDHFIVSRMNGYNIPMARWDIIKTASGSKIEFRRSVGIMTGEAKVTNCY